MFYSYASFSWSLKMKTLTCSLMLVDDALSTLTLKNNYPKVSWSCSVKLDPLSTRFSTFLFDCNCISYKFPKSKITVKFPGKILINKYLIKYTIIISEQESYQHQYVNIKWITARVTQSLSIHPVANSPCYLSLCNLTALWLRWFTKHKSAH